MNNSEISILLLYNDCSNYTYTILSVDYSIMIERERGGMNDVIGKLFISNSIQKY